VSFTNGCRATCVHGNPHSGDIDGEECAAVFARTKRLEQHLGVGSVVAQIGDNESVGIIAAIKPSAQRSSALGSSSSTRTAVARVCDCAIVSGQNIPNSRAHKRL